MFDFFLFNKVKYNIFFYFQRAFYKTINKEKISNTKLALKTTKNLNTWNLQKRKTTHFNMTDKPKRPLSAYMLWLNSARESIKREHPGIKVTEVAKKGGELWRAMKDKSVSWEFL